MWGRRPGSPSPSSLCVEAAGIEVSSSFYLHCEKQEFSKHCSANRAQSVQCKQHKAFLWLPCPDTRDGKEMLPSSLDGYLYDLYPIMAWNCCHIWTWKGQLSSGGVSRALLASIWPRGSRDALGKLLRLWQGCCSPHWAWFLSPSHRDRLRLGHDTWLKLSTCPVNPKTFLWLKTTGLSTLPVLHCNFWTPSLQSPFVQPKTMRAVIPWGRFPHPDVSLSPPAGTSQAHQSLKMPPV